jgi:hypothetical protein
MAPVDLSMPGILSNARASIECDRALEQVRTFRVSDLDLEVLRSYAALHPDRVGCHTAYLGAKLIYVQQLKEYLDRELEVDIEEANTRFSGDPETGLLRQFMVVLSETSSPEQLSAANAILNKTQDGLPKDRTQHLRFFSAIAMHRISHLQKTPVEMKSLNLLGSGTVVAPQELHDLVQEFGSSIFVSNVLRRFCIPESKHNSTNKESSDG